MIELSGNITGEVDGQQMVLSGEGNELFLEVDHPDQLLKNLKAGRSQRVTAVRKLAQGLQQRGLTFRLLSQGKTVAVLGSNAKAGMVSRLFRIPHLELRTDWRLIRLLVR